MPRLIFAALVALLPGFPALAQGSHIIGGSYAACEMPHQIQEAQAALAAGDQKWFRTVRGCFSPEIGTRVGVISRSGAFWKVRLFYPNGRSGVAWVDSQAVRSLDGNDPHLRRR